MKDDRRKGNGEKRWTYSLAWEIGWLEVRGEDEVAIEGVVL